MAVKNVVRDRVLHLENGEMLPVGEEPWRRWVARQEPFRFVSKHGRFTARCESTQYGRYWYAYRRRHQKLHKRYLGKDDALTLDKLAQAAAALAGNVDSPAKPTLAVLLENKKWDEVAACIEETAVSHIQTGQVTTLLRQLTQIPPLVRLQHKSLALTYARLLLTDGQTEAAERWLQRVQESATSTPIVDRDLIENVSRMEAVLHTFVGRPVSMPAWTGLAPESLGLRDLFFVAIAHWLNGDVDTTEVLLLRLNQQAAMRKDQYIGLLATAIRIGLAVLRCQIHEAHQLADTAQQAAVSPPPITIGALHIMQGYACYQQNELTAAQEKLEDGIQLMVNALFPSIAIFGLFMSAQIHAVHGESAQAVAQLNRALGMIYTQESISFWSAAELQALQAYLQLKLGNVAAASTWQKRYVKPPVSQTELFVYALVCVKNGRLNTAQPLLTTLLTEVRQRPRLFTPVDVLLPLAAVYWRQANVRAAVAALKNALHISQSQCCIRPFLDWAEELGPLFQLMMTLPDVDEHGRFFLKSVGVGGKRPLPHQTVLQRLAQLTGREQQLLEWVHDGATNRQIADALTLAESTVKSHLRHVYKKLAVANRKEAAILFANVRRLGRKGRW